jgi:tRNA(Ile2) C34 agmatinyltransferase TiaS
LTTSDIVKFYNKETDVMMLACIKCGQPFTPMGKNDNKCRKCKGKIRDEKRRKFIAKRRSLDNI